MVDSPGAKPSLRDFEPAPFAEQHVRMRHRDLVERDFHMAVRRIVIPEYRQVTDDLHPVGVERHENHRLLLVLFRSRIGLAHDDGDRAARIAGSARPPFAAVDDIAIALGRDAAQDVGRVGRGDVGLGHQEGRANLAVHQRPQPLLLLLARPVAVEHLHIAGVGRRAVERFRRPQETPHFLGAKGILEVAQAGPFKFERLVDMGRGRRWRHE